jgi:adenosine kinase
MSVPQGAILGLCNPLLDISAEVPTSFLEKYDVSLNNAILAEEKHMGIYTDLVKDFPVQYIAGGSAQNTMRVAQWMISSPGATAYMGAVGADAYGETLEKCATADGVLVHYQKNAEVPTGTCAVLIGGGERSLVANLAAANTFSSAHMETDAAKAIVDRAQIYYISGFFLTVSLESILTVANKAVANSKVFSMNLSAPFVCEFFGDRLAACMPFCDFVFGNESEAAAYGKTKGFGEGIREIALATAAQPKATGTRPRVVVFTQGCEPTLIACNGVITEYAVDPLSKELLVDTNGAGDAFVGGFLAQLAKGKEMAECVRAGHWAARIVIQRSGCSFPKVCEYA